MLKFWWFLCFIQIFSKFSICEDDFHDFNHPEIIPPNKMLLGKSFNISCRAFVPLREKIRLFWSFRPYDGHSTVINSQYRLPNGVKMILSSIIISKTMLNHKGLYECTMKGPNFPSVQTNMTFLVVESFIRPQIINKGNSVTYKAGQELNIFCEGAFPISWKRIRRDSTFDPKALGVSKIEYAKNPIHYAHILKERVIPRDVGNYSCVYDFHELIPELTLDEMLEYGLMSKIYIFVEEQRTLGLETPKFLFVDQNEKFIQIPCVPTSGKIHVTLSCITDRYNLISIYPRFSEPIVEFDPKSGFKVRQDFFEEEINGFVCDFKFQETTKRSYIDIVTKPSSYKLNSPIITNVIPLPKVGETRTLYCRVAIQGTMLPKIIWKGLDGDIITYPQGDYIIGETSMKFKATGNDTFTCLALIAGDPFEEEVMKTAHIKDRDTRRPRIEAQKHYLIGSVGYGMLLKCHSDEPIIWKRSFMDYPKGDITERLNNFMAKLAGKEMTPITLRGQTLAKFIGDDHKSTFEPPNTYILNIKNMTAGDAGYYYCVHEDADYKDMELLIEEKKADFVYVFLQNNSRRVDLPSKKQLAGFAGELLRIPCEAIVPKAGFEVHSYASPEWFIRTRIDTTDEEMKELNFDHGIEVGTLEGSVDLEYFTCEIETAHKKTKRRYMTTVIRKYNINPPELVEPPGPTMFGYDVSIVCTFTIPLQATFTNDVIQFHTMETEFVLPWKVKSLTNRMTISRRIFSDNFHDYVNLTLTITDLQHEDSGTYECKGTNLWGYSVSSFYYLKVDERIPPKIHKEENFVQLYSGEPFSVTCSGDSNVEWYKSNEYVFFEVGFVFKPKENKPGMWDVRSVANKFQEKNSTMDQQTQKARFFNKMTIPNVSTKEVGYYYCLQYDGDFTKATATDLLEKKMASRIYLYVIDSTKSMHVKGPEEIKIRKTGSFILPCRPNSIDTNVKVVLRNDIIADSDQPHSGVHEPFFDPTSGFRFMTSSLQEENIFTCIFENFGRAEDLIINATVFHPMPFCRHCQKPVIDKEVLKFGVRFPLNCYFNSTKNSIIYVDWPEYPVSKRTRNPTISIGYSHEIRGDWRLTNATLVIARPAFGSEGVYKCRAMDFEGNELITESYQQLYFGSVIRNPPLVLIHQDNAKAKTVTINKGGTLTLSCLAHKPIKWVGPSLDARSKGDITEELHAFKQTKNNVSFKKFKEIPQKYILSNDTGLNRNRYIESYLYVNPPYEFHERLEIPDMTSSNVGYYSCIYKSELKMNMDVDLMEASNAAARIYAFVRDLTNVYVNYNYNTLKIVDGSTITVPCKPSFEDVEVDLTLYDKRKNPIERNNMVIDKKSGIIVPNIDKSIHHISCRFNNNQHNVFYIELIPNFNNYQEYGVHITRKSKLEVGRPMQLVCKSRMPKNIAFKLSWEASNHIDSRYFKELTYETNCKEFTKSVECTSVLLIHEFEESSSGYYKCFKHIFRRQPVVAIDVLAVLTSRATGKELPPFWKIIKYEYPHRQYCGQRLASKTAPLTEAKQYPWLVRIGYKQHEKSSHVVYICSGSLISEQFVVTSAHCTLKLYPGSVPIVRLGDPKVLYLIEGEAYRHHEKFEFGKYDFDISVIKLKKPVVYSDFVFPICLPIFTETYFKAEQSKYIFSSWGFNSSTTKAQISVEESAQVVGKVREKGWGGDVKPGEEFINIKGSPFGCLADPGSPLMRYKSPVDSTILVEDENPYTYLVGILTGDPDRHDCLNEVTFLEISHHWSFIEKAVLEMYNKKI